MTYRFQVPGSRFQVPSTHLRCLWAGAGTCNLQLVDGSGLWLRPGSEGGRWPGHQPPADGGESPWWVGEGRQPATWNLIAPRPRDVAAFVIPNVTATRGVAVLTRLSVDRGDGMLRNPEAAHENAPHLGHDGDLEGLEGGGRESRDGGSRGLDETQAFTEPKIRVGPKRLTRHIQHQDASSVKRFEIVIAATTHVLPPSI